MNPPQQGIKTAEIMDETERKYAIVANGRAYDVPKDVADALKHSNNHIASIEQENQRLREALEAVAKPPYPDSNPASLLETLRAIAVQALATDTKGGG